MKAKPIFCLLLLSFQLNAQTLPCENAGTEFMSKLIGSWSVQAKERTSPGNYESNQGESVISWGIQGCSLQETYSGTYKGHGYAVKYETYLKDSLSVQRSFFDSEHHNLMLFEGSIERDSMINFWYRNPEKKRMQVKNELVILSAQSFKNTTHLSTDYGQTWQLTHEWVYSKTQR